MHDTQSHVIEPEEAPISVLLMGKEWDLLRPALRTLADAGRASFVGPVAEENWDAVAGTLSSLILASADFGYDRVTKLTEGRDRHPQLPILLCIAYEGLEAEELYKDVDDLLVIPCSPAELDKRIRRLALKHHARPTPSSSLQVGKVDLDVATYRVTVDGRPVELAWMEFQLLKFLMQSPGRVFTREHLLTRVWGAQAFVGTRTVDVHILRLRHKLGAPGEALFRTVKNIGYGLVESK